MPESFDADATPTGNVSYILGQLTAKIDGMYKKIDDYQKDNNNNQEDHEDRLRSLEKTVWKMSAISGMAGGIVVALIQYCATMAIRLIH